MKKVNIILAVLAVSMILVSCINTRPGIFGHAGLDYETEEETEDENETRETRAFPDDAQIVSFKWNHSGMAMEPYYILREEDDGWKWIISMDDENPEEGYHASIVVSDKADVEEFSRALIDAGILRWDGYYKSKSLGPYIQDGDDGFSLYLTLSDGSEMEAHGYNAFPKEYSEVSDIIYRYFSQHEDYSQYYPKQMPNAPLYRISIKMGSPYASQNDRFYRLELTPSWKQWIVELRDPHGDYLPEKTDIYEYGETEKELPLEDVKALLDKYDIISMNNETESWQWSEGMVYLDIWGYFDTEDDKMIELRQCVKEEDYADFIKEFIETSQNICKKMKSL